MGFQTEEMFNDDIIRVVRVVFEIYLISAEKLFRSNAQVPVTFCDI